MSTTDAALLRKAFSAWAPDNGTLGTPPSSICVRGRRQSVGPGLRPSSAPVRGASDPSGRTPRAWNPPRAGLAFDVSATQRTARSADTWRKLIESDAEERVATF